MHTKISIKGRLALVVAVALWASAFVAIRAGLKGYSPGGLALLRFLIASICMWLIYFFSPNKIKINKKNKIYLLLVGAIGIGFYNVSLNYGEIAIPSGTASFLISQSPILTTLFAIFFLGEAINIFGILGILISFLGVTLIFISNRQAFSFNLGLFYVLFATIIASIYSVLQKPFLKKHHVIDVTAYCIWGCTLLLLFFLPQLYRDLHHTSIYATSAAIYLGIFPAAIAYIAWNIALSELSVARTVNFLYFMPIIATFLGWLCLGEIPTFLSLLGGLIALLGVWIVNKSYHRYQTLRKVVDA